MWFYSAFGMFFFQALSSALIWITHNKHLSLMEDRITDLKGILKQKTSDLPTKKVCGYPSEWNFIKDQVQ